MENHKLLQLLKCILNRQTSCDCTIAAQEWPDIISMAKRHNIVAMLGHVLPLLSEEQMPSQTDMARLRQLMMGATAFNSNLLYAADQIRESFESQGIWNVALKGFATRKLYPNPDMRSMNDLDVLCKPNQQKSIRRVMEQLGYEGFREGRKHDVYTCKPFVRVEMHREMVAARSPFSGYYRHIWSRCQPVEGHQYTCQLSVTDAFVFNLVHLAEHLEEGGVGIRFVTDVYVYDHSADIDRDLLKCELNKLGLWQLYCSVSCLAECWFSPEKPSLTPEQAQLMQRLSDFVLSGGLFGSYKDGSALAVQKEGRIRHFLKACFPSYEEMRSMYSWLEKWPVLLPWSWFLRGVRSLLYRRSSIKGQLRTSMTGDTQRGAALRKLYRDIGYDK